MVKNHPDWPHQQNRIKLGTHIGEGLPKLTGTINTLKNSPKDLYKLSLAFFLYLPTIPMRTFNFFLQNIINIIVIS